MEKFIEALGLPQDLAAKLKEDNANHQELAKEYLSKVTQSALEREKGTLIEQAKAEAIKNANFSVWNTAEKKLAETLGINFEEFKDLEKGRYDAMLTKAKANIEELNTKLNVAKKTDEGKLLQVQEQLAEANKQLAELKKFKETEAPTLIEQARKQAMTQYLGKEQMLKAFESVKAKTIEGIDLETIELLFNAKAKLDFVEHEGQMKLQILDAAGKLFQKSATENYSDLGNFIEEQILTPKNWLKQQKTPNPVLPPVGQGANPNNPTTVHPGFLEYMNNGK